MTFHLREGQLVQRADWFDREFAFDLPVWMYPNVVERLRGTPARLEGRVGSLPGEILTGRDGDRWSIQENVGHLMDLEPLWLGRLEDFLAEREELRPADLTNRKTHEADHNSKSIEALLDVFRSARLELVEGLEGLDEETVLRTALHPRLKTGMRVLDLAFFVAEHDDHHLAEITELIRALA